MENFQYLYGPGFTEESPMRYLRTIDMMHLFLYSQEYYGTVDQPQGRLLFQMLDMMKGDDQKTYDFIKDLGKRAHT